MTAMNCAACKLWAKSENGIAGWSMGMGFCTNVPNFFNATEDASEFDPENSGEGARTLKAEFGGLKAMAIDGSGYRAELLTAPDFGCVSFQPRN